MILPTILPALLTGFALAFARAVGEYGSVVFICRQHADEDRDHAAADHHQARPVRLRRRDCDRRGHAGGLVRSCCLPINLCRSGAAAAKRSYGTGSGGSSIADGDNHVIAHDLPAARGRDRRNRRVVAVRWILIGVAVFFLALFLFLPLAIVFSQAFAKGIGAYLASLAEPDAWRRSA